MKFSIKDFSSKGDQIRRKLRIWSHLLKESLMENFLFLVVNQSLLTATFQVDTLVNFQEQLYAIFVELFKFCYGKQKLRNVCCYHWWATKKKKRLTRNVFFNDVDTKMTSQLLRIFSHLSSQYPTNIFRNMSTGV